MAKLQFTTALRNEYQKLFNTCQIRLANVQEVEKLTSRLVLNKPLYLEVGEPLGMPWYAVAVIHNMECSQNFSQHLHNGDPLTSRTIHIPVGYPKTGNPPFTWKQSATDALLQGGRAKWKDWSIPGSLYYFESYNGWGYRKYHPDVKTPYLWSGSNLYTSGKYKADGTWSDTLVSAQCGAATLLRRLAEIGEMDAISYIPNDNLAKEIAKNSALYQYAPNKVNISGVELQKFLNQFPGIFLKEDGKLGEKTSNACKIILGHYLAGDPKDVS